MIEKLSHLISEAEDKCKEERFYNLLLEASCDIGEIDSGFVAAYSEKAAMWQDPTKPESLIINHGHYIHRHGDGIKHLIDELKNKPDSNRALISLIDLNDIIDSGDKPIPSFMVLQYAFSSADPKTLYCCAYFRALEVSRFLPINIAEICLVTREIRKNFLEIETLNLTIHAFIAYSDRDFNCLNMPQMDLESNQGDITAFLYEDKKSEIIMFLKSKLQSESHIFTTGMSELCNGLKRDSVKYSNEIISVAESALLEMKALKDIRESSSHSKVVIDHQSAIKDKITQIIEDFEGL